MCHSKHFASTWTHHSEHSCHIGPFSYHIGHFLSFWIVSQKTMFSTSDIIHMIDGTSPIIECGTSPIIECGTFPIIKAKILSNYRRSGLGRSSTFCHFLCFEERPFFDNQPFSFSTSNLEELGIAKFSRRIFHLAPDEIHPLALLIPPALVFYCMICIVVAVERRCYEDTLFSRVQAGKPILRFSFSMLATSKRGITPPSCARTPHWLPFSLTTFSFLKKFGSLEKV